MFTVIVVLALVMNVVLIVDLSIHKYSKRKLCTSWKFWILKVMLVINICLIVNYGFDISDRNPMVDIAIHLVSYFLIIIETFLILYFFYKKASKGIPDSKE